MLAQNFKTAADLGISEIEHSALVTVLGMLERGEIDDKHFDMSFHLEQTDCGTVGCICGWAYVVSGSKAFSDLINPNLPPRDDEGLDGLFYMMGTAYGFSDVRPFNAAIALRSYLNSGKADWREALAAV